MIPALALTVPLLQAAAARRPPQCRLSVLVGARSCAPLGIVALKAAPELPAREPHSPAPKPNRNRAAPRSASQPAAPPEAANTEPDPEVRGIEAALERIEQDPGARQQFYADVDSLVRRVRRGQPIPRSLMLDDQLPLPPDRVTVVSASFKPPKPSPSLRPEEPSLAPSAGEFTPQPRAPASAMGLPNLADGQVHSPRLPGPQFLSPKNSPLDPSVVSRVIYWAGVNGCPVQLALAVAWQESGMNVHPARGSSGEIGIMQIMPERAHLEGVDPATLDDPETNIRLGTKLLARYYSEEGSVARAAMKYVAGPGVFEKHYAPDVRQYISWYSASVDNYARYFGRYVNF